MIIEQGQKFGEWAAVQRANRDEHGKKQWLCKCSCGAEKILRKDSLVRGLSRSCGCKRGEFISESKASHGINTGDCFGKLTAVQEVRKDGRKQWLCRCSCGAEKIIRRQDLLYGKTKSCGCNTNKFLSESKTACTLVSGEKFGRWTVIGKSKIGTGRWLCKCECGTEREIKTHSLIFATSKSCGCANQYKIETGDIYGYWTVLEEATPDRNLKCRFLCRCDCGIQRIVYGVGLVSGKSQSCGCYASMLRSCNAGELSPHWRGGDTTYADDFADIRESIRQRDNHTCAICKRHEKSLDRALSVHHINYEKFDTDGLNLISLCDSCHAATNSNREAWEIQLTELQNRRFDLQTV